VRTNKLGHVLVTGGDGHVNALRCSLQCQRADHVVGLDPRYAKNRKPERGDDFQQRLDLHPQVVRHGRPVGLVLGIEVVPKRLAWRIDHESDVLRPFLEVRAQHIHHAEQRAGRKSVRRCQLTPLHLDGVVRAI